MTEQVRSVQVPVLILAVAGLLISAPLHADGSGGTPVYRWVDARGEVYFSDIPPPEGTLADKTMIPAAPAPVSPDDDYFSVVNQQRRMQDRRWEVERERREARREAWQPDDRAQHAWRSWYYSPYTAYPYYGYSSIGYYHPHRVWQPGRPGHHPSHPPPAGHSRPHHSIGPRTPRAVPFRGLR